MRQLLGLFASLSDSGAAAAGSFLAGIVALRCLSTPELALYALLIAAGIAAMVVPQQMAYLPRRIEVNRSLIPKRGRYGSDVLGSAPHTFVAVVLVAAAGSPLYPGVDPSVAIGMAVAAMLWVAGSSFQDHVRTSLHITGNHREAAIVSAAQLGVSACGFALALSQLSALPPHVVVNLPLGTLALSNLLSAMLGVWLHRHTEALVAVGRVSLSVSVRTATSGMLLQSAGYLTNLIVALSLGASALAELEGARIVAQPVFVAAAAFSSYFLPPAIRLQQAGNRVGARKRVGTMILMQVGLGGIYAMLTPLLTGILAIAADRPINPTLATARAGAFSLQAVIAPLNQLNIAAGQYKIAAISTALSVAVSLGTLLFFLPSMNVYAVPLSMALGAFARGLVLILVSRK